MSFRPLVELHCHGDGSGRIETVIDEARRQNVVLPAYEPEALKRALRCGQPMELGFYVRVPFAVTLSVMQTASALERVAYELVEDWKNDGILYGEMRFMPSLHRHQGLRYEEIVEATLSGLKRGRRDFGVESGLIVCSMRHVPVEETKGNIDVAIKYRDHGVVAVDMAGDDNLPALEHAEHYLRAKDAGLPGTIHAAEAGPPERARQAVELFGAERIGHGLRIGEDPGLVEWLIRRDVPLEVCPTSNVQIGMTPSIAAHPAPGYYRKGLPITVNCDNRLFAGVTLTGELTDAVLAWKFSKYDVASLIYDAIDHSFAPDDLKARLHAELEADRNR
jgi:adenosine deaminase